MTEAFVVRYRTTPEAADENQRLVEAVYAELAERRPEGLQYETFRLEDGVSFVHIARGNRQALGQVAAFQEFQHDLAARVEAPPDPSTATVIGSYDGVRGQS
jgi:hypothetical protein